MTTDPRYGILFDPIKIGPVTAPNRFYAVPHATGHTPMMPNGSIGMRAMKAEGGWGVVCMQLAEIDPSSDISNLPIEKLWDETDVLSHRRMVERVKQHGSLAAIELAHTGLRSRNFSTGMPVMAPSSFPILKPEAPVHAKAMDKSDIKAFRRSHRAAVARSRQAGYDIVYVYAAHDASLLWHFLSPMYNLRSDEYGGSFENRVRLLREVLEDTMDAAKGEMAVAIRFAVHDFKHGSVITYDKEGRYVVEALAEIPDLWDVNVAGWSRDSGTSRFDEEGFQEKYTSFVKRVTTKPVVGVGRFTSPDAMVSQIRRGVLDLIGGARPSIADPFLPNKIKRGRIEDIRECIGCNICVASDAYSVPLRCTQNPTISEEWRRNWHPEKFSISRQIKAALIVGGGPAGLECGHVLARAGHQVTLADKATEFGGRVARESRLKGLAAWGRVRDHRLYLLQQMANASLYLESEISAAEIGEFDAEQVFVATGASWRNDGVGRTNFRPIPGFTGHVLTPDHVMNGHEVNGPVVIYDDDHYYMGNVLAAHLVALGHEVHLVCPLPIIASWMGYTLEQPRVVASLHAAGVRMYPNTTAVSWSGGELNVVRTDIAEPTDAIRGATLICVTSRSQNMALYEDIIARGEFVERLELLGDAVAPGLIQAAVLSGHQKARLFMGESNREGLFLRETPVLFA